MQIAPENDVTFKLFQKGREPLTVGQSKVKVNEGIDFTQNIKFWSLFPKCNLLLDSSYHGDDLFTQYHENNFGRDP